ncbi:hypothetical protein E2C01_025831 [Portunus trituberculatus]|uniref:Uncharacterized protein n=1 Tax=Portunus trituberculatus TaxID=210409 RepID=A0A5B7EGI4_PORTR|nr:hypothetical protein [Portunus trituberculatus]
MSPRIREGSPGPAHLTGTLKKWRQTKKARGSNKRRTKNTTLLATRLAVTLQMSAFACTPISAH